jgi:nucleoside-diphosphate-sugar epimerase
VKKILIIGSKSLLSSNIERYLNKRYFVKRISFCKIIKDKNFILNFDFVINCTFDIKIKNYKNTADYILANYLINKKIIYIMLSTCKVYGLNKKIMVSEKTKCRPNSHYGKLKFTIEKKVTKLLKKNALILRLSNILQFDLRKSSKLKTFINKMLLDLKMKKKIFIPLVNYKKDFLPINLFNVTLEQLIQKNITGTYNIGTGIGLSLDEFAKLLIKGYGRGKIYKINDDTDNMILNINKLKKKIVCFFSKSKVENQIIKLGKQLTLHE